MSLKKVLVGTCWPLSSAKLDFEEIKGAIIDASHVRVCAQSVFFIPLIEEIILCSNWNPIIEIYAPFFGSVGIPGVEETDMQKHEHEKLAFLQKITLNQECGSTLYDLVEVMPGGMEFRENFFTDIAEIVVYGLRKPDPLLLRKIFYAASVGIDEIWTIVSKSNTEEELHAWNAFKSLVGFVDASIPRITT